MGSKKCKAEWNKLVQGGILFPGHQGTWSRSRVPRVTSLSHGKGQGQLAPVLTITSSHPVSIMSQAHKIMGLASNYEGFHF